MAWAEEEAQDLPRFRGRHRILVAIVLVEAAAVLALAVLRGYGWEHGLLEALIPLGFGIVASWSWPDRWQLVALGSAGLLSSQMIITHLLGGDLPGHLFFFATALLVSFYRTRLTTLLLAAYLVLLHGLVAVWDPHSVYLHDWTEWQKAASVTAKAAWVGVLLGTMARRRGRARPPPTP